MRKGPQSIETFIARPRAGAWNQELRAGWAGPDGSSMSTDTIMGVRIGITSRSYKYVDLPANRHDWYYRLGRRYRLPSGYRAAADWSYCGLCIRRCRAELAWWSPLFWVAWVRSIARYIALRFAARFAWTQKAKTRRVAWQSED